MWAIQTPAPARPETPEEDYQSHHDPRGRDPRDRRDSDPGDLVGATHSGGVTDARTGTGDDQQPDQGEGRSRPPDHAGADNRRIVNRP